MTSLEQARDAGRAARESGRPNKSPLYGVTEECVELRRAWRDARLEEDRRQCREVTKR